ncbi:MAG: hypothetical protein SFX74_05560 [Fimbriimonadaceae bacterium]|nr:hypothetical protein [Fimbriimonadaceae bacterium]
MIDSDAVLVIDDAATICDNSLYCGTKRSGVRQRREDHEMDDRRKCVRVVLKRLVALVACLLAVTGCNYSTYGYVGNCDVDTSAPQGRTHHFTARCMGSQRKGVRSVMIKFAPNRGEQIYNGPGFKLNSADSERLVGILKNASYRDTPSEKYRHLVGPATDVYVVVYPVGGHGLSIGLKLDEIEPYYGEELARWVDTDLRRIVEQQEKREPSDPPVPGWSILNRNTLPDKP